MSRINTNVASLTAIQDLSANQADLALHLQRLSTGLRINTAEDDPAGLIASQQLRSEMAGIQAAINNSQRAGNVINTAEGSLSEVSSLLLQVQALVSQAANVGALSPSEIQANQLQVDSILSSINRISDTTQFNGVTLLNGSLDYTTSGLSNSAISNSTINLLKLPQNGASTITVQVTGSAKLADIGFTASGIGATPTTIEITGNLGAQELSFAASAQTSAIAVSINQLKTETGVSATLSGSALRLSSLAYGSSQFVSVRTVNGTFNTTATNAYGSDAIVSINGTIAHADGLTASLRQGETDITLNLTPAFAQQTGHTTSFYVTGGGALFQLGAEVGSLDQTRLGIGSVSTDSLGNSVDGFLSSLGSGGANSLIGGNLIAAQTIISDAISQVSTLRGRLGAFESDVIQANTNSLSVALENVTASESDISDADFATETSALTRAQILVQAGTSVLAQANAAPEAVLDLLK
jgi:flagellin